MPAMVSQNLLVLSCLKLIETCFDLAGRGKLDFIRCTMVELSKLTLSLWSMKESLACGK